MLIIFGFSIVVLLFIIYNIADFFELKKEDCCCCYKKTENRVHEMDRRFEDIMEMGAFDEDGNYIFGKKHVYVQTEMGGESKGVDV
jgi:hypothetical protein